MNELHKLTYEWVTYNVPCMSMAAVISSEVSCLATNGLVPCGSLRKALQRINLTGWKCMRGYRAYRVLFGERSNQSWY